MNHLDAIRGAERACADACVRLAECDDILNAYALQRPRPTPAQENDADEAYVLATRVASESGRGLRRLRALTCETCKGNGGKKVVAGYNGWGDEVEEWRPCPAHCASGAKREG